MDMPASQSDCGWCRESTEPALPTSRNVSMRGMRLTFFPLVHTKQPQTNPASKDKLMPGTATYPHPTRRPLAATLRALIWIEKQHFHGWCCSECAWVFN